MRLSRRFTYLLALLLLLTVTAPAFARGLPDQAAATDICRNHVKIQNWNNQRQIEAHGFNFTVEDTGAREFKRAYLRLGVATDLDGDYSAARINEVNTELPPEERVKCWEATADRHIEAEYRIRWGDANVNPSLTETALLGNAPPIDLDPFAPFSAVGVTRTPVFGAYGAVVAQGFFIDATGVPHGYLDFLPLFEIDPVAWHTVRVTIWQQRARVEIEQEGVEPNIVLEQQVSAPFEALGAEFSLDNELLPGIFAPIGDGDNLDLDYYEIRMVGN